MLHKLPLVVDVLMVVPNPTAAQPDGLEGIDVLLGWVMWGCYIACFVGLLYGIGTWVLDRVGRGGGEHMLSISKAFLGALLIGAGGGLINAVVAA